MPLPKFEDYTTDYIYSLPDGERAELIDGQIYDMAPPNTLHQKISGELHTAINQYIKSKGGSCDVFSAPFAVFLNNDSRTYVEPDISVICDKDKLDDRGCNGAPDWVIEVVSPSSKRMDYSIKLFKYRSAGVREYWIINPETKIVQTYNFEGKEDANQYSFNESIKVGIYDDLIITVSDLL